MKQAKINKYLFIILLISILFVLTGCESNKNIENYYYVVAIGLDTASNNQLTLTVQIATSSDDSSSSDSSQSTTSSIYSVECSSINSGISILDNFLSKKLNFSHCSAIIFSEELAKLGIEQYINTFSNSFEIRPNSQIIISNTSSKEALECISNSSEPFSAKLYEFIINSVEYTGYSIDPELR